MTNNCHCQGTPEAVANIAAGLDGLPHQARSFGDIRNALLRGIARELPGWRASEPQDLGVMWLEMWAYLGDVLGFYDERIANESYYRTAVRATSLRRHVALLGYLPRPGLAGSITVAAIADGRQMVTLPPRTAFRSAAFGAEAPQVFELATEGKIDPLLNQWTLGSIKKGVLPEHTPSVGVDPTQSPSSPAGDARFLTFEPAGFSLAKDRLLVLTGTGVDSPGVPTKVKAVKPFTGIDGKSYVEVEVDPPVYIAYGTLPAAIRAVTPTMTAHPTMSSPIYGHGSVQFAGSGKKVVYLDGNYPQVSRNQLFLTVNDSQNRLALGTTRSLSIKPVQMTAELKGAVTAVEVDCGEDITADWQEETFHFNFVSAGQVTVVGSLELTPADLAAGVQLDGVVQAPSSATVDRNSKLLSQRFLLRDADEHGAMVEGAIRFDSTGRAVFSLSKAVEPATLDTLKVPVRMFGNLLDVTRGTTVTGEILGSGDPRIPNQSFGLRQKPLTYLEVPDAVDPVPQLWVYVENVLWLQVKSFYSCGSDARVYVVQHDDAGNTNIVFGDGTRGARLPSGVDNVVATYRYGAGSLAPPANSVEQIARGAPGLKSVFAPLPGRGGRDSETVSPAEKFAVSQAALLLGRLVSVRDFEVFVSFRTGVKKAFARLRWDATEQRTGVVVSYIGSALPEDLRGSLLKQADPNIFVEVEKARPVPCSLEVDLGTHPDLGGDAVAAAARESLTDAQEGILSPANAAIGGTLWSSQIVQALLAIPGAVEVVSAKLTIDGNPSDLKSTDFTCVESGTYFDFGEPPQVVVNPVAPTGSVVDVRRLRGGC